jgi:hypothetical protein
MARASRPRPGRALAGAAVLLAGCCLLGTGCQQYAAAEPDGVDLPPGSALVCDVVEVTAPRPEGLLDEVVVTAPAPAEPALAIGEARPGAPTLH